MLDRLVSEIRVRLGAAIRDARLDRGWSQAVLGAAAGLSQALISDIESGDVGASIESLASVARALDAELSIALHPPRVIGRSDQQDPAHARCVAACRRVFDRAELACVVEREIVDGRMRGWVDLLGYSRESRRLVLAEIRTEIRDIGGLERRVGTYVRACVGAVRDLGWQPKDVVVVVALLATAANDTVVVVANRLAFGQAFPMRGAALAGALFEGGPVAGWGLAMVDPRRRGARTIQGSASTAGGPTRRTETIPTSCASFIAGSHLGRGRQAGVSWRRRSAAVGGRVGAGGPLPPAATSIGRPDIDQAHRWIPGPGARDLRRNAVST